MIKTIDFYGHRVVAPITGKDREMVAPLEEYFVAMAKAVGREFGSAEEAVEWWFSLNEQKRKECVRAFFDYKCLFCSKETETNQVHENITRGAAGDAALVPWNMQPPCAYHHKMLQEYKWKIYRYDPLDKEDGLIVIGTDGRPIPKSDLWFYRQVLVEELRPIVETIQGIHRVDGQIAYALHRLRKDDAYKALDPEAVSFSQFCASQGWDARRAVGLAKLYERAEQLGLEWPPGMTATDFRRELKNEGKIKERAFWYVVFEPLNKFDIINAEIRPHKPVRIVRTDNPDALVESLEGNEVAVRVGKWFGVQAKDGVLTDRDGNPIEHKILQGVK